MSYGLYGSLQSSPLASNPRDGHAVKSVINDELDNIVVEGLDIIDAEAGELEVD